MMLANHEVREALSSRLTVYPFFSTMKERFYRLVVLVVCSWVIKFRHFKAPTERRENFVAGVIVCTCFFLSVRVCESLLGGLN